MIKIRIKGKFDLDSTVSCGQIFRFYRLEDGSYDIILTDRVINVRMENEYLIVSSNNEYNLKEVVFNYFDLGNNYDVINKTLIECDNKIALAVNFSNGLKMIKQEPFETIIEYIISANNGVNQIARAVNNIAVLYGQKVEFNKRIYYLFPSYTTLKNISLSELRSCKVGFRDRYIKNIIDRLNNKEINLQDFYSLDTKSALDRLMENEGIGPKVASCILLFAYQKYDVFPVDTWVKKVMEKDYGIKGEKNIREFASKTFGKYSAIAIQYMFNYGRNNKS